MIALPRVRRRVWLLCSVAMILPLLAYVGVAYWVWNQKPSPAPPNKVAELLASMPPVGIKPGAAELLVKADADAREHRDRLRESHPSLVGRVDHEHRGSPQWGEAKSLLGLLAPQLAAARQAADVPVLGLLAAKRRALRDDPNNAGIVDINALQSAISETARAMFSLSTYLAVDASAAVDAREGDRATDDICAIANMVRLLEEAPTAWPAPVFGWHMAREAAQRSTEELCLAPQVFSDSQLQRLARSMTELQACRLGGNRALDIQTMDKALADAFTDDGNGNGSLVPKISPLIFSYGTSGRLPNRSILSTQWGAFLLGPVYRFAAPDRATVRSLWLGAIQEGERQSREPLGLDLQPVADELQARVQDDSPLSVPYMVFLAASPRWGSSGVERRPATAWIEAARCLIATERFRRARGRWPERLQELVPDFLPAVPRDPYNLDTPIRYELTGGAPGAWSVGFNGVDDGGPLKRDASLPEDVFQSNDDLGGRLKP